jgi:hypothetical protein
MNRLASSISLRIFSRGTPHVLVCWHLIEKEKPCQWRIQALGERFKIERIKIPAVLLSSSGFVKKFIKIKEA